MTTPLTPQARRRVGLANAIPFFVFWLLVLLAGADRPPPRGFWWLVLLVAVCAAVVYWRIPTYVDWYLAQRPGRLWRVALEGLVAGLVVAGPALLRGSGEPGVNMRPLDYLIALAVLGALGALNATALYAANAAFARRYRVAEP